MSRSPARFNRRPGSGRCGKGSGRVRWWRHRREPVEQLVQDRLLVLQEALVAVHEQRGGAPLRVSRVTDFVRSEERREGKSVDLGGRRIIKKKKKECEAGDRH